MTMRAPVVSLRNVTKRFANGTLAVDGISLDLDQGSFTSLLGPSGCGKSTLLRLIAGLSEPTSGAVERPRTAGTTSFVFQEPTLMPWTTALGNVLLPLDLAGIPRKESEPQPREVLAQVGLKGFEKSYPRELSSGMKMRVSIARGRDPARPRFGGSFH
ncbi:MAG: ATP-binding cassette domain-containing protein [Pigmentiphaga sp.]|nr:ATP-binding cassette domain-containing protein [Pigmentiphaga sp.]